MTAPVRLWPPELGKASGALGGQERVLSAVGQPDPVCAFIEKIYKDAHKGK